MLKRTLRRPFTDAMADGDARVKNAKASLNKQTEAVTIRVYCQFKPIRVTSQFPELSSLSTSELEKAPWPQLTLSVANAEISNDNFDIENAKVVDIDLIEIRKVYGSQYANCETVTLQNDNGDEAIIRRINNQSAKEGK